jgi:DNA-binding transcriptional LysR family regulator
MELRHLRYFVAVGQALNFTKAAMRLHLAQPALSRQVSDLEDELGVNLLKRTSHGVLLTPEGKLFLEAAITTSRQQEQDRPKEGAQITSRAVFQNPTLAS